MQAVAPSTVSPWKTDALSPAVLAEVHSWFLIGNDQNRSAVVVWFIKMYQMFTIQILLHSH